nr:hypothetical protein [uncultured marine thaumarchaeote KM3_14_C04]AIF06069.1 hypothetical protein [uncultured marine thaumarchaeote KM3_18_F10]
MKKHVGSAKRSVMIKANVETVWKKLSKITKLGWLEEQKSTKFLLQKKYGVGAIRLISFEDGSNVEEHIVWWSPKEGFAYIAITGLPLVAYLATISMKKASNGRVKVTWQSYFVSDKKKKEFLEFSKFLDQFYSKSLQNLKSDIETN